MAAAAAVASSTVIPNGEWCNSKSSCGVGTARGVADSDDLPGVSAAVSGGGSNDGR